MIAYNIDWDTDGEDVDLPNEIEIPEHITDLDEASDYITNITGFCHRGFGVRTTDSIHNKPEDRLIRSMSKGRGLAYTVNENELYRVSYIGGVSRFAVFYLNIKLFIMWLKKRRSNYE